MRICKTCRVRGYPYLRKPCWCVIKEASLHNPAIDDYRCPDKRRKDMITDQGLKRLLMAMYGREELDLPEGEELGYVKANVEHAIRNMIRLRGYPAEMALRNRRILYGRFGLDDDEPMGFKELAKKADLTPSRVRQIVLQMLRSLRHPAFLGRGPVRLGLTISEQIFGKWLP